MHHLYLSPASEITSSVTGMFDQLCVHSGGISEGRVQTGKKNPFSNGSGCSVVSTIMYLPFNRNSWSELISQFSAIDCFVWEGNGRGKFSKELKHSSITKREVYKGIIIP